MWSEITIQLLSREIRCVFMEIQFLKLKYIKIYVKSVKNSKIQPLQLSDTAAQTIRHFNRETKATDTPRAACTQARLVLPPSPGPSLPTRTWVCSILCHVQQILSLKKTEKEHVSYSSHFLSIKSILSALLIIFIF